MAAQELYAELRPGAFAIAYRMLGSASDAEDLVQKGLLRLHRALGEGERLEFPQAYLSTVVTRLAIDELRSARVRRETSSASGCPSLSSPQATAIQLRWDGLSRSSTQSFRLGEDTFRHAATPPQG